MKKHYVRFYSPGTLTAEVSVQEVESWDIEVARSLAADITERHGAIPYGFCFYTMVREGEDWEPHEVAESPMYYLPLNDGDVVLT